jgi:hypothetical protein
MATQHQHPQPLNGNQLTADHKALEVQTFGIAYESVLEQIANGITLDSFCREYIDPLGYPLHKGRFLSYIMASEKRKNQFYGAKAVACEVIEADLIRLSDGLDLDGNATPNEVARSQLQINTRWKLLATYNPKRYGDVKRIEQTVNQTTTNVSQLTSDALQLRVLQALGITADELVDDTADNNVLEHDSSDED